ncbi:MAG: ATP-binding protein [Steroidobacteraceae bacterium]
MQLPLIASPRKFLHLILWLRVCAVVGESITIGVIPRWFGIPLPVTAMAGVIAALAATVVLTALRLRQVLPATELEVAAQLLIDIAALTVLLCLSGGTTNPFSSLYLIPVALSAVGLAWQYTALITGISLGCYVYLIDRFTTLTFMHMSLASAFGLHMTGMHTTFAVNALLLAAALSVMAGEMRRRDQAMAALREEVMRKEHWSAMGVLAAGAAHELSTPLLSMAILVSELRSARRRDAKFRDNLALLDKQIALCKEKLTALLKAAGRPRSPEKRSAPIRAVVQEVVDSWSIMRPATRLEVDWRAISDDLAVTVDEGFAQVLVSLLDNAAQASESKGSDIVRLTVARDGRGVRLYIDDEGPGLTAAVEQRIGKAIFTTKKEGFGLGLVLSHANLNRIEGDLTLTTRPEGGTRTMITLPAHANGAANAGE